MIALALLALLVAALVAGLTIANVRALAPPSPPRAAPSVAILIPARNEEAGIGACLEAALASRGADFEVIMLDDASTDRTRAIAEAIARRDRRLRVETAPPLPPGWNGKQHACFALAGLTERPNLLFIDADVRLGPDTAARMAGHMEERGVDLNSGVPRQIMGGWSERLLIPMINALILSFLPIPMMRRDAREGLAAGCGQLMAARRDAYRACGGHSAIRATLHDGLKLPRLFRRHGLSTDLVDASGLAQCRMYGSTPALLRGLLKNATEGMATPLALPVWTALLLSGFVLPWVTLAAGLATNATGTILAALAACALSLGARVAQVRRAREPGIVALLTPVSVLALLALQWTALVRQRLGIRTEWRGRAYEAQSP